MDVVGTAPVLDFMSVADRLGHQLKLRQKVALGLLGQRAEVVEQSRERHLLLVELPRRDLPLDRPAEEFGFGDAVDRQEALELRELHRADPLARLERADGLLPDAGESRHVLLAQATQAAYFTKFENEIH